MAYRLDLGVPVPQAVRAAAAEQLADAVHQLTAEKDPVRAVHEARKDLKKVRSLLRLSRCGMLGGERREVNARLRDIAAQMAGARDADVMVATAGRLHERFAGQLPATDFALVQQRFAEHASAAEVPDGVVDALRDELAAVERWNLVGVGRRELIMGAALAYARGRDEFRAVRREPEVEALHEWRKRVKDLWYHAKLLEAAWPPMLAAYGEEAHALSDLLGDDHDLGILAERIAAEEWPGTVDAEALEGLCHQLREELQEQAFELGRRLYAEKPKAFARRLAGWLGA
jgi:CHAD domain-containing protein